MFFFSNRLGCGGSILLSAAITFMLLWLMGVLQDNVRSGTSSGVGTMREGTLRRGQTKTPLSRPRSGTGGWGDVKTSDVCGRQVFIESKNSWFDFV